MDKDATLRIKAAVSGQEELKDLNSHLGVLSTAAAKAGGSIQAMALNQAAELFSKLTSAVSAGIDEMKAYTKISNAFTGNIESLRAATKGTVSDLELMQTSVRFNTLGVKMSDQAFAEFSANVKKVGGALGKDFSEAMDSASTALARGSARGMIATGVILDVEKAYDKMAETLGKNVKQLTEHEKLQAKQTAYMEQLAAKAKELPANIETGTMALGRMWTMIKNLVTSSASFADTWVGLKLANIGRAASYWTGGREKSAAEAAQSTKEDEAADVAAAVERGVWAPQVSYGASSREDPSELDALLTGKGGGGGMSWSQSMYGLQDRARRQPGYYGKVDPTSKAKKSAGRGVSQAQWDFQESQKRSALMEKEDDARLKRNEAAMAAIELDELKLAARGLKEAFEGLEKGVEAQGAEGGKRHQAWRQSQGIYTGEERDKWLGEGGQLKSGLPTDGNPLGVSKGLAGMGETGKNLFNAAAMDKTGQRMRDLTAATKEFDSQLTGLASGALVNSYSGIMNLADAAMQGKGNLGEMALAFLKGTAVGLSADLLGKGIAAQVEAAALGMTPWTAWMVPFAEAKAATFFTGAAAFGAGGLALMGISAAVGAGGGGGAGASAGGAGARGSSVGNSYRPSYGNVEKQDARPIVLNVWIGGKDDLGAIPYARRQIATELGRAA